MPLSLDGNGSVNGAINVDAVGNVGVGTTTPVAKFHVVDAGTGANTALVQSGQTGTTVRSNTLLRLQTTATGRDVNIQLSDNVTNTAEVGMVGGALYFATSGGERLRISSGGDVGVGTTTPGTKLDVNGNIRLSSAAPTIEFNTGGAQVYLPAANTLAFATGGGIGTPTERARITSAGNFRPGVDNAYSLGEPTFRWSVVYSTTGTINTSDIRAKTDFAPTFGLDFINALEPVSYRYKNGKTVIEQVEDGVEQVPAILDNDGNEFAPATTRQRYKTVERVVEGKRRHHGLKAQQVKSVVDTLGVDFAGWVMDDPNDPESGQGLRYDQFIAPLIKAVQELSAKVADLEKRITQ